MEKENNKFTWGDSVIIIKSAPDEFHPGEMASVCGFYQNPRKAPGFSHGDIRGKIGFF
jgi:hypothetical protein